MLLIWFKMASCIHLWSTILQIIILSGLGMLNVHLAKADSGKSCTFCRQDQVAVDFTPLVSVEDYILNRYNLSDLMPFVSKISSEFKIILCPFFERPGISARLVPEAVADWNVESAKTSNDSNMEVWMDVMLKPTLENMEDFLYGLQVVIYTANEIYPGTVTTLLFPGHMADIEPESFNQAFTILRDLFPSNIFKIALEWEPHAFEHRMKNEPSVVGSQIARSFHLIDFIIFTDFLHDNFAYPTPRDELLQPQVNLVKTCIQFVKDNVNASISFGVSGGISDTSDNGFMSYSRYVQIVKQFVSWGRSENLTVILYRAFDVPCRKRLDTMATGWWRLVENSSYRSTADYVFEDKQTIAYREAQETPEKLISIIQEDVHFDREKVAVKFNPVLAPISAKKQHRFNFSSVPVLLDTIATKFSIVSVCHLDVIWRSLTPLVFANYNNQAKFPLNIIYTINLTDQNELDFTADKVVRANQLYPNTVTKVQLVSILNATNASVSSLRSRLNQNGSESGVKVGYILSIEVCSGGDKKFILDELELLLQFVDFVHFSYIPGLPFHVSYKFGVDRVVAQVIRLFDSCKRRMGNIFPGVEVAFETGFPDTLESREEDYISLVLFWKEINSWATKTNTDVIMNGVFDSSYDHEDDAIYSRLGWWRVSEVPNSNNELVIEEKRNVAVKRYRRATVDDSYVQEAVDLLVPIAISISVILATVTVLSILVYKCKHKPSKYHIGISYASQLKLDNDDIVMLPETSFNPESSTLIGTGNFGAVYKCYISQLQSEVAVKIVSRESQMDDSDKTMATKSLLSEINIMSHVGHHDNILRILGVCQEGRLFLVTEYCVHGSLLSYLRSESLNGCVPSTYELLQFCMEIANGMNYLQQKNVIHGDLSARNVLLDAGKICKISDFGLSRKLELYEKYMKKGEEPLPWRWMAFESLTEMEFSAKSDVWSMGVTFWEVFTLGKTPFPGMRWNEEFCTKLAGGLRLEKPTLSNNEISRIMLDCWQIESNRRPTAAEIAQEILGLKRNEYVKM